ncbi:MAG: hypothetical protein FWD33_01875 [Alphaproteobacteria bacterium]|nr:hypothetical protein [Alphaproteobacteria bacterium]
MIFYGALRVFPVDEDDSQMIDIGKFNSEMWEKYPHINFKSLGHKFEDDRFSYLIGKLGERPEINEEITEVLVPDEGWEEYSCPFNRADMKKLYDKIWAGGPLDFEIETIDGDVFNVMIHRKK